MHEQVKAIGTTACSTPLKTWFWLRTRRPVTIGGCGKVVCCRSSCKSRQTFVLNRQNIAVLSHCTVHTNNEWFESNNNNNNYCYSWLEQILVIFNIYSYFIINKKHGHGYTNMNFDCHEMDSNRRQLRNKINYICSSYKSLSRKN